MDGEVSSNLAKLTLFKQFYIVIIGYLCLTRIIVFVLRTIVAYDYQWMSNAAEETGRGSSTLRDESFRLRNFAATQFCRHLRHTTNIRF
ncbi:hypothetical protein P8452_05818 [Trifolium repens]|nr:hypothetical protein P8452_05818 [Trifolium repens]